MRILYVKVDEVRGLLENNAYFFVVRERNEFEAGQRSYNAVIALQKNGFSNVFNVASSFLVICLYEYFTDTTTNRDKIV
jgi:hypothetical protein